MTVTDGDLGKREPKWRTASTACFSCADGRARSRRGVRSSVYTCIIGRPSSLVEPPATMSADSSAVHRLPSRRAPSEHGHPLRLRLRLRPHEHEHEQGHIHDQWTGQGLASRASRTNRKAVHYGAWALRPLKIPVADADLAGPAEGLRKADISAVVLATTGAVKASALTRRMIRCFWNIIQSMNLKCSFVKHR